MTQHSITVSRAELAHGLRLATLGVRRKTTADLRFSVESGFLEIMGPGAAHSIAVKGTWPSAVLADAGLLKRLASRLPAADPIMLRVENSRLYIGTFSMVVTVLDIAPTGTQLPIGVSPAEILVAIERLGEARVVGSIGIKAVENARKHLTGRIEQAAKSLELYGVAHTELASLVRRAINERATSNLPENQPGNGHTAKVDDTSLPPAKRNADHDCSVGQQASDGRDAKVGRLVSDCWSCRTHDAILEFTNQRYSALARKTVFQLQRIKATGVYGDDYRHKTLWDEYCHEVQEGPYDVLDEAWNKTLDPVLGAIIDAIPSHEATLLTIGAIWDLDEAEEPSSRTNSELIQENLQQILSKMAGARDMSRFDPTLF